MSSSLNPVLVVHGIWDSSKKMKHVVNELKALGKEVYAIDLSPSNGSISIKEMAEQIKSFVEKNGLHKFDIVSFSMGGIVSKYYLIHMGGKDKVSSYVSISSPHQGTYISYLNPFLPVAKELKPKSSLLLDLQKRESELSHIKCLSIWTPYDLMILPAWSSAFSCAQNIMIPVLAHPLMIKNKKVLKRIKDFLHV